MRNYIAKLIPNKTARGCGRFFNGYDFTIRAIACKLLQSEPERFGVKRYVSVGEII